MVDDVVIRFLAMEYYRLIWNRSFEIAMTSASFSGALVRGSLSSWSPLVSRAIKTNDASVLVSKEKLERARATHPDSPEFLKLHQFNFRVQRSLVREIRFDPRRKWGMGPVPHSGRIHLELQQGSSREFILLGEQDGVAILETAKNLGYEVFGGNGN